MTVNLPEAAVTYVENGLRVFPLARQGKVPAIPARLGGRGVLDATEDPRIVAEWWRRSPSCNIGGAVPLGVVVVDIDGRNAGPEHLAALEAELGPLPRTLTCWTGSGGGSRHLWFRHPGGRVTQTRLPAGVELRIHGNYCVLPPSVHPSGGMYRWDDPDTPIAALPPAWVRRLRPPPPLEVSPRRLTVVRPGDTESVADWFSAHHSWGEILVGWRLVAGDGESDGSRWRHPTATSPVSATIRHGCLFVYSPTPGLPVTTPAEPHGLTRFRAWAHLEFAGDLSAAAREARRRKGSAA
jgi:hypothetical protein